MSTPRTQRHNTRSTTAARPAPNTPGDGSVASRTSTGSARPGVAWNIQKALAQELEKAFPLVDCPATGNSVTALLDTGQQALSKFLGRLLDEDPESAYLFGVRGDADRRKKIGDLVQGWKKKDKEEYRRRVLIRLKVKQEKGRKPKQYRELTCEELGDNGVDSDLSSDGGFADFQSPTIKPKLKPKQSFAKARTQQDMIGKTITSKPTSKMSDTSPFSLLSDGTLQETVYVDIKHPERTQYPFKVKTAGQLKGVEENKTFQGYYLEMRVHPCDAIGQDDHLPFEFKSHIYSSNEIVVEVPVLDYTDMGHDDDEVRDYLEDEDGNMEKVDEGLMEAYDNFRNGLIDRIDNKTLPTKKTYRVVFPSNVHLSGEVLGAHKDYKESNRLYMQPLPIEYVLRKQFEIDFGSLTWEDVLEEDVTLPESTMGGDDTKKMFILPKPSQAIHRFVIELADLNKDARKRGKIVKAADTTGTAAMMAALGKRKKKKGVPAVASHGDERQPRTDSTPPRPTDHLSTNDVKTRIDAACSVVAAELSIGRDDVMVCLQVEGLYAFCTENNLDLVDVVRETHKRTTAINANLDQISEQDKINREELSRMINWFDVYEFSIQHNRDLTDVMLEAIAWVRKGRPQQQPPPKRTSLQAATKPKPKIDDLEMQRLSKFKAYPDGKIGRAKRAESKGNQKRESLLRKMRDQLPYMG